MSVLRGRGCRPALEDHLSTFTKEFSYDARGRKVKETDLPGAAERYETLFGYDAAVNLVSRTDREGKTTTYEYDGLNRLVRVIDPVGSITEYEYDARDNLISLKDAKGNATRFEYDRNNRLVKETRPMGQETTYRYDAAGNLIEKIDAKNRKTVYNYDDAGRMTGIRYYSATDHNNPVKTVSFTYDMVGNLVSCDDGITSATYTYDAAYRKLSETVDYGPFSKSFSYAYYANGLKKSYTGPDGVTIQYSYDSGNRLAGIDIPGTGMVTFPSYTWNRPARVSLPGGGARDISYDPLMRIKEITSRDPGENPVMDYDYSYDRMDNITAKRTNQGDYIYGYDDLYRLTTVDNPTQDDEAFTYDPVGNRLTSADISGTWTYNRNNELLAYNGVTYQYDANGNTIRKNDNGQVTSYTYNMGDRLERVEDGSGNVIAEYYYDPFGRRLWKEVGGTRTYFLYADEGLVGEYSSTGAELRSYGYKPNSTWTTDPLFLKQGNQYYFYHNDHLGTPQKLTSISGAVAWSATYASFGKATVDASSTITNNLRFPGQYEDEETRLHYNYHRYYDPRTGRYLRADPIGILL